MFLSEEQLAHDVQPTEQDVRAEESIAPQQTDDSEYSRLLETADIARAGTAWGEQDYLEAEEAD